MRRARHPAVLAALVVPAVALAQRAEQTSSAPADHAALPPPPLEQLAVPAGWEAQPAVIEAARAAAAAGLGPRAMSGAAWGRPLLGCHVVQLAFALDTSFVPSSILGQLRAALEGAATVEAWADEPWLASATLARPGWRAELRAVITAGNRPDLEVIACLHDERAPDVCQAACAPLLAALPAPAPTTKPRTP